MNFSRTNSAPSAMVTALAALVAIGLFLVFFYPYFATIDAQILSHSDDWAKELRDYQNITHQLFRLGQFPHTYRQADGQLRPLWANPETAILTPLTLLLPLVSIYQFFVWHLALHYLAALVGAFLLQRLFNLSQFAAPMIFFLFGLNGRILANYDVGHSMFATYLWLPLFFFCYFRFMKTRRHLLASAGATALIMALIFFEGGVHLINWLMLFFLLDALAMVLFQGRQLQLLAVSMSYLALSVMFFGAISAVKLLPARFLYAGYSPEYISGYRDPLYFLQTFYQAGLGVTTPFAELWREEAYNYIGPVAFGLAMLALLHGLLVNQNKQVKRMAVVAIAGAILSFGDIYHRLFQHMPFLSSERVGSRYVFLSLAMIALLIPIFLQNVFARWSWSALWQEGATAAVALIIFYQLYGESRGWWLATLPPFTPPLTPLPVAELPAAYFFYFYAGLFISGVTWVVLPLMVWRYRGKVGYL